MILVPNFPYTVHDEPSEDWTVEQLIQWYFLRSQAKTQETRDELIESLQKQFEDGKAEVLSLCDKAIEKQNRESTESSQCVVADENVRPLQPIDPNTTTNISITASQNNNNCRKKDSSNNAPAVKKSTIKSVTVLISSGPYAGNTFVLKPKPRYPCFAGRSAGKKFRERGISMPDDPEVSTTHAKFEMKARKIYFTDMGSTNGTLHEGIELEPNVPLEVHDGMELLLGGHATFKLSLGYT
mmetsp:Transcript_198/g.206  ORF Transcript_198/g.206 Transcript_198/m.206 type:complete len:240 (-) Transcript_198:36-755(-)|eukprot:CAMPEP_0197826436 /NCGR_PEP_ID=MMETSP1437-20131217/3401_1 /TAXON_ID=49252 ORGANISM="Eucampia antarctica, Strain CCMP1452" /NCGR_SAMPLE_ID=MMETSP1437 /ASSEMBLY_ACC=CAM_ASM_001096 /LENGTH=239 /DNA_ID=CAMNT_0043426879 /DNA_START=43 /DNA_END=762 /DNA_ORIENTATION=+